MQMYIIERIIDMCLSVVLGLVLMHALYYCLASCVSVKCLSEIWWWRCYFIASEGGLLWLWQWWVTWPYWDFWDQFETAAAGYTCFSGENIFLNIHFTLTAGTCPYILFFWVFFVLQAEFDCINMKKKQKKKNYKNSGVVSVKLCQVL